MNPEQLYPPLNILLAEDDTDDRFFFDKALKELPITTHLTTFHDGEQLMKYLFENSGHLPDVVFLDINMPRKNGYECMAEIKENILLKDIFVVMFSTFYSRYIHYEQEMTKKLHDIGVHEFIRKSQDFAQLKQTILKVLITATEKRALKEEEENL